jgi:pimeloyl-ACP methyl ester carboxylesterase
MRGHSGLARIDWAGRLVEVEYQWVGSERPGAPCVVFLHEGLGSVALWKDFPKALCEAGGFRGMVFSRPGYGRSTPRAQGERWAVDFLHRQAHEVVPAVLDAVGIVGPAWLFGHSDGASIALLMAAHAPERVCGVVALAPHIFVEDVTVQSIGQAREAYVQGDLRQRLARYHDDPDSAFGGWSSIWLDPAFRAWNIVSELARVRAPVLAVQGLDDEYGSLAQLRGIAQAVPGAQMVELPDCGHSPHRDRAPEVIAATTAFMAGSAARP